MTNRWALSISYDGASFAGWQTQPNGGGIEDALARALRVLGEDSGIIGAGRTDAGVHARAQVASVSLSKEWDAYSLASALNAHLPQSVRVVLAARAKEDFDARRSASSREYRYFVWHASVCYPHIAPYVCRMHGSYDWERAAQAARLLEGRHDFRAFCRKRDCPPNASRRVKLARLRRAGRLVVFRIEADAFLTNMIRIIMGNLVEIAAGRRDEAWFAGLLEEGASREASARTMPPSGLFFWKVNYPEAVDPFRAHDGKSDPQNIE